MNRQRFRRRFFPRTSVRSRAPRSNTPTAGPQRSLRVLVAHPSADLYGADLQLLETVSALVRAGHHVHVVVATEGPLLRRITERLASAEVLGHPVLRRAHMSPLGLVHLAKEALSAIAPALRLIAREQPDVLLVNTVTVPLWLLLSRLTKTPALCHVHEADSGEPRIVRIALYGPLLAAQRVIANSQTTAESLFRTVPRLKSRTDVIHNGVSGPPRPTSPKLHRSGSYKLLFLGRLSPRKAPDVAVAALMLLRKRGLDVELEICGDVFPGYEWFEDELRTMVYEAGLAGSITWGGYTHPVWPALERCDALLAPSLSESFGNVVVEAQMAHRPVVAAAAGGHLETIDHRVTGLLVPPGNPEATADAVHLLLREPALAEALARAGERSAAARFSSRRYAQEVVRVVTQRAISPARTAGPEQTLRRTVHASRSARSSRHSG